jgi:conjugal transfer pilus assembly protein TraD
MKLFGKKHKTEVIEIGEGIEIKKEGKKGAVKKIVLPEKDRNRHLFSFGTTGVGKTRLIEGLAEYDIIKGRNVLIIDPKGDGEL